MKKIKLRKLNMDAVLKVLILLGFVTFFFITVKNGTIHMFVHPRIISYIKIGIIVMLAMELFQLKEILKPQRKQVNIYQYLFFIIPLVMAFTLPAKEVNLGTVSFGNKTDKVISSDFPDGNGNSLAEDILSHDTNTEDNSQNDNSQNVNNSPNTYISIYSKGGRGESSGLKLQDDTVVMDDSNFVRWVDEVSNNPLKYQGKKVTVSGFVFKDKQFKSNEFVPARMMMTCCAADMSIVGLPAQYRLASELKQDSWFKFSGIIVNGEFNGQPMPIINIESAEKIEKPQYEYVYPY